MTEYISKDQVLKIIDNVEVDTSYWAITRDGYVTSKPDTFERLHTEINNLTTVDVAPVVHGHWKFSGEDGHGYGLWRCIYCGNVVHEKAAKCFCPYCGARMDGGNNND